MSEKISLDSSEDGKWIQIKTDSGYDYFKRNETD